MEFLHTSDEPAINTFDPELARERVNEHKYKYLGEKKIKTVTLSEILNKHMPVNMKIDFLSVDVEGFDLEVLLSNDWNKFRPEYVVVECFGLKEFEKIISDKVYIFFTGKNYSFFAKTVNTCIFKNNSSKET